MSLLSPSRNASDIALASKCVAGDRGAQRELFAKYRSAIHGAIFRILGSNDGIDDAIQDAFIEVFRSLPSYRGEAALGTWIHIGAVRVAYAHIAKRARTAPLEVEPSSPATLDEVADAREAMSRLYGVLEKLTPAARVAFVLSAIEGKSNKEVAELMEATEIATKVRVWRARRQVEALAAEDPVLAQYVGHETLSEEKS